MNTRKVMAVLALLSVVGCNTTTADKSSPPTLTSPPTATGPIDPSTGMPKSAVTAITEIDFKNQEQHVLVFYYPDKVSNSQLAAAPTKVCSSKNLALLSSEVKTVDDQSIQDLNLMQLIIICK